MDTSLFHLAQLNVARAVAPVDDPRMAGFVAQIAEVNALAEASPGFVWRLRSDAEIDYPASLTDPRLLVNFSIWESVEALRDYAYSGQHLEVFRARRDWFDKHEAPGLVAWWIPAGHLPSLEEAEARLEHLRVHGPTEDAFSLKRPFPPPNIPADVDAPVLYEKRTFVLRDNTPNGESDGSTLFHYRQTGPLAWASYSGGAIKAGILVAGVARDGSLEARYHHVNRAGEFRSGVCRTIPEMLGDGRLRLHEEWRWTDGERGRSVLEEVAG